VVDEEGGAGCIQYGPDAFLFLEPKDVQVDYAWLQKLADAARPIDDADWGSDRQIEAENEFCAYACCFMEEAVLDQFDRYVLKATSEEIIDNALDILRLDHKPKN
jgi:hypothetical protein